MFGSIWCSAQVEMDRIQFWLSWILMLRRARISLLPLVTLLSSQTGHLTSPSSTGGDPLLTVRPFSPWVVSAVLISCNCHFENSCLSFKRCSHQCLVHYLDLNDGQFLIAMRCRCFWPFLTIAIGAIFFGQLSGPIVCRWFFQSKDRCLAMIFMWKP